MHPAHMAHPVAARATAGQNYERQPDTPTAVGETIDVPYFPEGGVAAPPFMIVNPVSHGPNTAPGNGSPNELVGPASAEWITIRDTHFQGRGVPRFKAWPRQFHNEAYNFTSLAIMPQPDQLGPRPYNLVNRPEKAGWSVPKFSEQYEQGIGAYGLQELAQTNDPASVAFAMGWGFIG